MNTPRSRKPKPKLPPKPVRLAGYLECTECGRTIPYAGYQDPDMDTWPEHRCAAAGLEVRPFSRWALKLPVKPIILSDDPAAPRRALTTGMIIG